MGVHGQKPNGIPAEIEAATIPPANPRVIAALIAEFGEARVRANFEHERSRAAGRGKRPDAAHVVAAIREDRAGRTAAALNQARRVLRDQTESIIRVTQARSIVSSQPFDVLEDVLREVAATTQKGETIETWKRRGMSAHWIADQLAIECATVIQARKSGTRRVIPEESA